MCTERLFIDNKLPNVLSKEETYKLFELKAEGSNEAREKLIVCNIRLVIHEVLNKYLIDYDDNKDLVSIGILGLIKAINTFDITKKNEFTTYAVKCIDNEILMYFRKLKKITETESMHYVLFTDKYDRKISLEEKLYDTLNIETYYEQKEVNLIIRNLINELSEKEREVIKLYFGFYDNKLYTQKEISKIVNTSQSNVYIIIKKSLQKLSNKLEENDIIELKKK